MSDTNLANEIAQTEQTRSICSNLVRILKEASFPGSISAQVAVGIDFLLFLQKQADHNVKELKKRMAKGEDEPTPTPAPSTQPDEAA